jgi:hypothetical protein
MNNFKLEWMQLRRSFRYNEYHRIADLNPPTGPIGKVRLCACRAALCGAALQPCAGWWWRAQAVRCVPASARRLLPVCAPPCRTQLTYAAGSAVVKLFSRVDEWLESRHWFTLLLPQPLPSEVWDATTGRITGQCRQVRVRACACVCVCAACASAHAVCQ